MLAHHHRVSSSGHALGAPRRVGVLLHQLHELMVTDHDAPEVTDPYSI